MLIAVRMKSARLPRKALANIEGKTVIEHVIERVCTAGEPDSTVLCTSTHTDDGVLLEIADRMGICGYAGDPDDVMDRFLKASELVGADTIVRVTGDNPLTDPAYIDRMIRHHWETGAEYTYVEGLPRGTKPEIISVSALDRVHGLTEEPRWSGEYLTYFLKRPDVLKVESVKADPPVFRPNYRLTLDEPPDLDLVRRVYHSLYRPPGRMFSLQEVVQLLDSRQDLVAINAHVKPIELPPEVSVTLRGEAHSSQI